MACKACGSKGAEMQNITTKFPLGKNDLVLVFANADSDYSGQYNYGKRTYGEAFFVAKSDVKNLNVSREKVAENG